MLHTERIGEVAVGIEGVGSGGSGRGGSSGWIWNGSETDDPEIPDPSDDLNGCDLPPPDYDEQPDIDDDLPGVGNPARDAIALHAAGYLPDGEEPLAPDYLPPPGTPSDVPVHGARPEREIAEQREVTGFVVDLAESGLQSLLWRVGEAASLHISPVGPAIVRGIYLGKQLHDAIVGLKRGEGFFFTLTVPGLDLESGGFSPRASNSWRRYGSAANARGRCRGCGSAVKSRSSNRGPIRWTSRGPSRPWCLAASRPCRLPSRLRQIRGTYCFL